uniref:Myotubularin-related protein 12 n=1 Tax=Hucho hucho TaxID=62062 RepID=A0A4W5M042_9TELE
MLSSLGSAAGKSAKPSFVSYVTPEEIKSEKEPSRKEKHPDLLPGEVVFCSASTVLKYTQDDLSQRGVFGALLCTNFRVSFVSDEAPTEEMVRTAVTLNNGQFDRSLHRYEDKKKLITGGLVKNKYPSKIIIHCKDLRVFQFSLTFAKEEDAKKIFQGIVHHCLEPKSLRCLFAFSYCENTSYPEGIGNDSTLCFSPPEVQRKKQTVMFDSVEDWTQDMKRTKGNCRVVSENSNFELSPKLPQLFIVPTNVSDEDLTKYQGKGLPMWCWSHHSGCGLFKTASIPLVQEDNVFCRMLTAVAHNHLYSVKTEDLSDTLPTVQDIQLSYNKFKQFFLIDNTTEFWMSDMKWFSSLDNCGWLDIIRQCLQKAVEVVECLEKENTNVLIMGKDQLFEEGCILFDKGWPHILCPDILFDIYIFFTLLENVCPTMTLVTEVNSPYQPVPYTLYPHTPSLTVCLSWQAESPYTQRGPLNCLTVWDWSVQFDCKAQDLFTNPLYTEKPKQDTSVRKSYRPKHLRQLSLPSSAFKTPPKKGFFKDEADNLKKILGVKRLSRWMLSPSSDSPQTSSSVREFYEAWQTKPLDYHGLLLPCLDGPSIRVWMQRYLRWIHDVQILGGGPVAVLSKISEILGEVQELQRELDRYGCTLTSNHKGARPRAKTAAVIAARSSVRLSSSFPFVTSRNWSFKPAIPTSLLQSLMVTGMAGNLANREDDGGDPESLV